MPAGDCTEPAAPGPGWTYRHTWAVRDYDLAATLESGQVFRWQPYAGGWEGIVAGRWVRLTAGPHSVTAETCVPLADWAWLGRWLRVEDDLAAILATFPDDPPLRAAVAAWRGLRLLRQEPWECLASFLLSSTKQIVHIRRIVAALCQRYGEPVPVPPGREPGYAFPAAARLAAGTEAELRACGMGFRAPYLRETARRVAAGEVRLEALARLPLAEARAALMALPGVGRKIADCVLLFAGGFDAVFPVDVWVRRALRELSFPRRQVPPRQLLAYAETHFGPYAGYAQQYLFHFMRTRRATGREGAEADFAPGAGRRPRPTRAGQILS